MAINHIADQPGSIDTSDPVGYPYGKAQNESALGAGDGTAWVQNLINDILGWQQALLVAASIVPSGTPESATVSDYLDAIDALRTAALAASPAIGGPTITGGTATSTTLVTAIINLATITSSGDLQIADGGTAASTALGAFNNIKQAATELLSGVALLASQSTTDSGTDDTTIVTPLKLHSTPINEPFAGSVIGKQSSIIDCLIPGSGVTISPDAPSGQIEISAVSTGINFLVPPTRSSLPVPGGSTAILPIGMHVITSAGVSNATVEATLSGAGAWSTIHINTELDSGVFVYSNGADVRINNLGGIAETINILTLAG